MQKWYITALMGLLMCGTAQAASEDRFARMDVDKNGSVSWEEFEAAIPQMRKPAFESIDTDKNNAIDRAEWDTFRKDHGQSGMGAKSGMTPSSAVPASPKSLAPSATGELPVIQPPKK